MAQIVQYTPDPKGMKIIDNLPKEGVRKVAAAVSKIARKRAPVGNPLDHPKEANRPKLRRSIRFTAKMRKGTKAVGGVYYGKVYTTDHKGGLIEKGTGIYGSRNRPIRAKNGGVMWFRMNGRLIRASEVKGRPKTPFLAPSLADVSRNLHAVLGDMTK